MFDLEEFEMCAVGLPPATWFGNTDVTYTKSHRANLKNKKN